jgi:hypothetical protein
MGSDLKNMDHVDICHDPMRVHVVVPYDPQLRAQTWEPNTIVKCRISLRHYELRSQATDRPTRQKLVWRARIRRLLLHFGNLLLQTTFRVPPLVLWMVWNPQSACLNIAIADFVTYVQSPADLQRDVQISHGENSVSITSHHHTEVTSTRCRLRA